MKSNLKNISASVHQRLQYIGRLEQLSFNELLQYYAMERFLYRLSRSSFNEKFVLKGALVLRAFQMPKSRSTRDIDLLGSGDNSIQALEHAFTRCCEIDIPDDGLVFDPASVHGVEITEDAKYQGVRITLHGNLGNAKVHIQIDIGFGDVVEPGPIWLDYTEILDFGTPKIKGYTLESIIAEKFQIMVKLDMINSRLKDFYDIWFLAMNHSFNSQHLLSAIQATFNNRFTALPDGIPVALRSDFSQNPDKQKQWAAFCRRILHEDISFTHVISLLRDFLMPPIEAHNAKTSFKKEWIDRKWK